LPAQHQRWILSPCIDKKDIYYTACCCGLEEEEKAKKYSLKDADVILRTASVLLDQIRETPNVAQSHRVSNSAQHELQFIIPFLALG
jgi:hypothetical protein